jgi:tetratricopeptide (TPR) repeat protein
MNGPVAARLAALGLACGLTGACTTLTAVPPRERPPPIGAPPAGAPAPGAAAEPLPTPAPSAGAPSPAPARAASDPAGASASLLAQSRAERGAGRLPAATALVERALRLDPNNAELWVERGELELATGNTSQAAVMARKALTLPADAQVTARAERLLRASAAR